MILVDQDSFSNQFASMLRSPSYVNTGNYQQSSFHFVNDSSNLLSDLPEMLNKATVQFVTTNILLHSHSFSDLIFRLAKSPATTYSNIIWVDLEHS